MLYCALIGLHQKGGGGVGTASRCFTTQTYMKCYVYANISVEGFFGNVNKE